MRELYVCVRERERERERGDLLHSFWRRSISLALSSSAFACAAFAASKWALRSMSSLANRSSEVSRSLNGFVRTIYRA